MFRSFLVNTVGSELLDCVMYDYLLTLMGVA